MNWRNIAVHLVERARDVVVGFFDWNTRTLVRLATVQAGMMRIQGRWAEALTLLEKVGGISEEDYADPARILAKLRQRHASVDRELALGFRMQFITFLVDGKRIDVAVALCELDAGLEPSDYDNPVLLNARLESWMTGISSTLAYSCGFQLAYVLGLAGRPAHELAVLESLLSLEVSDYADFDSTTERLACGLAKIPEMLRNPYLQALAATLGRVGRESESRALVSLGEKLSRHTSISPDSTNSKLRTFMGDIAMFGERLLSSQSSYDQEPMLLNNLEAEFNLTHADYQDWPRLASKLHERLSNLPPELVGVPLAALIRALLKSGRPKDALAVVAADMGCGAEYFNDSAYVASRMKERCFGFPAELEKFYFVTVAHTFEQAGLAVLGAEVLEHEAGLKDINWNDRHKFSTQLVVHFNGMTPSSMIDYVSFLAFVLDVSGNGRRAGLLADAIVLGMSPLTLEAEEFSLAISFCNLYEIWLRWWGKDATREPLSVCSSLVPYLRGALVKQGVVLEDREEFIRMASELRRRIIDTGLYWVQQESDPEQARRIALDVQLWDAELAQRLLIERFLLEPIRPVAAGPSPVQGWPWEEPLTGSDRESYLPPPGFAGLPLGTLDEAMGESTAPAPTTEGSVQLQEDSPELFQKAREIIREGVDERRMALAVGAGGVLLRATFDFEGRLLWSALRSDGWSVRVAALGGGDADDLDKLRWASVRHDFRMALARLRARKKTPMLVQGVLSKVRESLEALRHRLVKSGGNPQGLERIVETLLAPDQPGYEDLLRLLIPVLSLLQSAPDSGDFAGWASGFRVEVENLLNRLSEESGGGLQSHLDQITSEFIQEVHRVWDLEGLAEALTPETDLVVQLDDALHAVPIAYLEVAGVPLFQRVRSIRSSLALLLTTLQLESEEDVREQGDEPGRLLSVSHLRQGDRARDGALWLQHGFSVLARRHGLEAYAAADQPPGSAGLLRTALEEFKRFHVLAVCGHGDYFKSGIELAPAEEGEAGQLWQGEGCDLGGVDWLWMVSCSIGRLGQNGDRDVEGFCVRLALHRARSVAAFRWPVHSAQAVALVNESVHLYLESLRSADARCLRARALNEARKRFFAENPSLVGLNTAAACELFGLG